MGCENWEYNHCAQSVRAQCCTVDASGEHDVRSEFMDSIAQIYYRYPTVVV